MTYRYELIPSTPTGAGNDNGVWHQVAVGPTSLGPPLELAVLVDFATVPYFTQQVAGYAALYWTDNGRYGGLKLMGATVPILLGGPATNQPLCMLNTDRVAPYRGSGGELPSDFGLFYYLHHWMPAATLRFWGAYP